MTSDRLKALLSGSRWAGSEKVPIAPDEVYFAASEAQREILNRTNVLEDTCHLVLSAGQDTYTFPTYPVTNIRHETVALYNIDGTPLLDVDGNQLYGIGTNGTKVHAEIKGHTYHDGDDIYIYEAGGSVEANGKWSVIVVDADNVELVGLTTITAYTSGGHAVHALATARALLPSGMRRLSDATGTLYGQIDKKTLSWIESERETFGSSANLTNATPNNGLVIYCYEIFTDPLTIGFLGTPAATMTVQARFYRRHLDGLDDISATVDPIIPGLYDKLLTMGTLYNIFDLRTEKDAATEAEKWRQKFELEIAKAMQVQGKRKFVPQTDEGLRW